MKSFYKTLTIILCIFFVTLKTSTNAQVLSEIAQIGGGASLANDIKGNTLFFANGQSFTAADISKPSKPALHSELKLDYLIIDIKVIDNYAYVVTNNVWAYFNIIDISDLKNMKQISSFALGELQTDIFEDEVYFSMLIDGDYAYLNKFYELQILNISNPKELSNAGRFYKKHLYFTGGLTKANNKLLCGIEEGLESFLITLDVTNPAEPIITGSKTPTRYICEDIFVKETTAYITEADMGLATFDISDIENPILMDSVYYGYWFNGITVENNIAYLTLYGGGVASLDVSDPYNLPLSLLDVHNSPMAYSTTKAISYYNNFVFLSSEISGIEFINVSNPSELSPVDIESMIVGGRSTDMTVVDGILYIANGTAGLTIVDVKNPHSPKVIGVFDCPGYAYDVCIHEGRAYLAHSSGLSIFAIKDPYNAYFEGEYYEYNANNRMVYGVEVKDDLAFCAYYKGDIIVLDISDKTNPKYKYFIESTSYSQPTDVMFVGDYLYVADAQTTWEDPNRGSMSVVDISDLDNPVTVDTEIYGDDEVKNRSYNMVQKDTFVYIADEAGVFVFGVSNPADPVYLAQIVTGESDDIAIDSNYLYVAKGRKMIAYDISNPLEAVKKGTIGTRDYTFGVEAANGLCYIADCDAGVFVVRNNNLASWIKLSDDGNISEGTEDGEIIMAEINGDTFVETLSIENWQFENLPEGVQLGSVNRIDDTSVEIILTGNSSSPYTSSISDVTVVVSASELSTSTIDIFGSGVTFNKITAIQNRAIKGLKVYPNPVVNHINIKADTNLDNISIYDNTGRMVMTVKVKHQTKSQKMNLAELHNGIYFMVISDKNNNRVTQKIIK